MLLGGGVTDRHSWSRKRLFSLRISFPWELRHFVKMFEAAPELVPPLPLISSCELKWEHILTPHEVRFLRGHRVGRVPLLPGTCYIELVRVAKVASHDMKLYSLDNVTFLSILFLDDITEEFCPTLCVSVQLDQSSDVLTISSQREHDVRTVHAEMRLRLLSEATFATHLDVCLLYTSPSPRDRQKSRMPSSA